MAKPKGSPRKPTSNELPTPPKGTRVVQQKKRRPWWVTLLWLCGILTVVSVIFSQLPGTRERIEATRQARVEQTDAAAVAVMSIVPTSTELAEDTATLPPTDTAIPTDSPTSIPSDTLVATSAPAVSLFATNTPRGSSPQVIATAPPTATVTPTPTATPQPVMTSAPVVTMYTRSTANLRSCANTDNAQCPTVTQVNGGTSLQVVGEITGSTVDGNTLWKIVVYNGQQLYIHSSLVQSSPPVVASTPVQSQQLISTPVPAPSGGGLSFTCNGVDDLNCGDFAADCSAAQQHLNTCGDEDGLDGNDHDGLACESGCR